MQFITGLLLSFLIFSCYNPERNCQDFKTGTFEYEALIGTELLTTTFKIIPEKREPPSAKGENPLSNKSSINYA